MKLVRKKNNQIQQSLIQQLQTVAENDYSEWDKQLIHFDYDRKSQYIAAGIIPIEPMTAKEIMEKDIDVVFNSDEYIVEEKFDGVRANIQFVNDNGVPCCRVFSRRKSVGTAFYKEKSDNLPQIRNIHIPELTGTILDGEMIIPNSDFKTTSAILNCLPAEAIERQQSAGEVIFYAFDCLYFKGKNIMNLPLSDRKRFLREVISTLCYIDSIVKVDYFSAKTAGMKYYNDIVKNGGEGVMIKDLNAPYEMKRTRAYQKMKKKFTREVVILGYNEPTKEYNGKFPNDHWMYWINDVGDRVDTDYAYSCNATVLLNNGYTPVTKNWYEEKIGAIRYGVIASEEMTEILFKTYEKSIVFPEEPYIKWNDKKLYLHKSEGGFWFVNVGECEGMTDDERAEFSRNREHYIGKVIEVECNEIFKDTGKLRHPRFVRERDDKSARECIWEAHING